MTLRSIPVLISRMRETLHQQARSWHARPGSSRPFPVRRDPIVNADCTARGRPVIGSLGPVCASAAGGSSAPSAAFASLAFAAAPAVGAGPRLGTWVGLAGGRMGDVHWSVKVARPPGSAERPCLQVGTKRERGRFDYERSKYQGCVERSSRLAATESPLIVTGAQASAGMQVSLTAVGMVASPAARRIQVTYDDGRQATIPLQQPSPNLAAEARPGPLPVRRVRHSRHLVGRAAGHRERLRQDALGQRRRQLIRLQDLCAVAVHASPLFFFRRFLALASGQWDRYTDRCIPAALDRTVDLCSHYRRRENGHLGRSGDLPTRVRQEREEARDEERDSSDKRGTTVLGSPGVTTARVLVVLAAPSL